MAWVIQKTSREYMAQCGWTTSLKHTKKVRKEKIFTKKFLSKKKKDYYVFFLNTEFNEVKMIFVVTGIFIGVLLYIYDNNLIFY